MKKYTTLLCLLLVVAARHMGLISFGEADSFYDTAVSYYSEQFGDAASAQSQDPPSFARFYTRAADTSILNSDVSLDLERILQENVLLEGEGYPAIASTKYSIGGCRYC